MPQSLVENYIHITFSTKNRQPIISSSVKDELFNYLGGVCKELESQAIIVGETNDHVHLLINLSRKIALMTLIEKIKTHSSKCLPAGRQGLKQKELNSIGRENLVSIGPLPSIGLPNAA